MRKPFLFWLLPATLLVLGIVQYRVANSKEEVVKQIYGTVYDELGNTVDSADVHCWGVEVIYDSWDHTHILGRYGFIGIPEAGRYNLWAVKEPKISDTVTVFYNGNLKYFFRALNKKKA